MMAAVCLKCFGYGQIYDRGVLVACPCRVGAGEEKETRPAPRKVTK